MMKAKFLLFLGTIALVFASCESDDTADIIIEEFIPGRDIYLSLLGGKKLKTLPIRELCFTKAQNAKMRFATYKAKWDDPYRKKWGIKSQPARGIDEKTQCTEVHFLFHLCHIWRTRRDPNHRNPSSGSHQSLW